MVFEILILSTDEQSSTQLKCKSDENLLQVFLANKIKIDHTCGGFATCGTCKIKIIKGELNPRNDEELEIFTDRNMSADVRLSCQSKPLTDLVITIL